MTHVAATRHLHEKMHIRLAPGYWTLVLSSRIFRFFRSLGYRIDFTIEEVVTFVSSHKSIAQAQCPIAERFRERCFGGRG